MSANRHSGYMRECFQSPRSLGETARKVIAFIREQQLKFDAIAVRGVSGAVMGAAVASRMNKQLVVVRKRSANSHGSCQCEGLPEKPLTYIILDDFVSSGKTIANIWGQINYQNHTATCVGVVTYNYSYAFQAWEVFSDLESIRDVMAGRYNAFSEQFTRTDGTTY